MPATLHEGRLRLRARLRDYLDSVADHWLGFAYPPVHVAIEDANWHPDSPDEYCHRCGDSVAPGEATATGCATCREGAELAGGIGDALLRLGTHTDSLRHWINAIKSGRWTEMAEHLGELLAREIIIEIRRSNVIDLDRAIIVPMPTPWQRRLFRGVDHTRAIALGASGGLRVPIVDVLVKNRQPPQVSLIPSERRRRGGRGLRIRRRWEAPINVVAQRISDLMKGMQERARKGKNGGAGERGNDSKGKGRSLSRRKKYPGGWDLRDHHIILIDDVRTTGSTLKAAVRLLRTLDPDRIICAVAAVSDSKARRVRKEQATRRDAEAPTTAPLAG